MTIVESIRYLGIMVNNLLNDDLDIVRVWNKFYNIFNGLLRKFNSVDKSIMLFLFRSFCLQLYGADLWISKHG